MAIYLNTQADARPIERSVAPVTGKTALCSIWLL